MEPWSGCAWLQIMYTASEIAFLPDQGDIAITKGRSDQKNVVHRPQERRLRPEGRLLRPHLFLCAPGGRKVPESGFHRVGEKRRAGSAG